MTTEKILEYMAKTPENTNFNVVRDMIDENGNPNYVETIEGTLANPWGDYTFSEILNGLKDNSFSIYIRPNRVDIYYPVDFQKQYLKLLKMDDCDEASLWFYVIYYTENGLEQIIEYNGDLDDPSDADSLVGSIIDYTEDEKNTPCTLTIIHHPMPESGS